MEMDTWLVNNIQQMKRKQMDNMKETNIHDEVERLNFPDTMDLETGAESVAGEGTYRGSLLVLRVEVLVRKLNQGNVSDADELRHQLVTLVRECHEHLDSDQLSSDDQEELRHTITRLTKEAEQFELRLQGLSAWSRL